MEFPVNVYRLAMAAGSNRDFNSIHHNREYARLSGAPDAYANVLFLMGMWERAVRDWAGSGAQIIAFKRFTMRRFNLVGTTTRVGGEVVAVDAESEVVSLRLVSEDDAGVTVGPSVVDVRLPGARS
ncbi:acyl dehydratase [Gordonia sp. (in: high G+C Gram-positive bacteria)]|uniref:acyl dehydratase n=1 Tax=Gordonia sp. (in: high G+C Gram-positive bacteria) TaxID=84139 RepID=UPI003F98DE39